MSFLDLPDEIIFVIAQDMDYTTLWNYSQTSAHNWPLLRDLRASKFVEYVRDTMKCISAGNSHTAFINNQGQLFTMGWNNYGQLGLGQIKSVSRPTPVGTYKVVAVSCGYYHTAFITDQGQLYVMGRNDEGQLNPENVGNVVIPTLVEGYSHNSTDATIPAPIEPKVATVSAGGWHTTFITNQGQLYVMGNNEYGQLGLIDTDNVDVPTLVQGYSYSSTDVTIPAPIEPKVVAVSAGKLHTAFITDQKQLYVMGYNGCDQLGFGRGEYLIIPTPVIKLKAIAVSAGKTHTAFITEQRQLYVMGLNEEGQLGLGHTNLVNTPTLVEGIKFKVAAVSVGGMHTAFITEQGQLYVMGRNEEGQLGLGDTGYIIRPKPTLVEGFKVTAVSAGEHHTIFVTVQGQLYVMGNNGYDQLGLDHGGNVYIPTKLQ